MSLLRILIWACCCHPAPLVLPTIPLPDVCSVCRRVLSMLQTKPWQQSAGSCQHLRLLTSKGVVLYDKQLNCLDMKWFKHEDIDCGIETHLGACVCAERILSGRQLQWISIDGHLVSVKPPPRESPHPHNLNSPAQLTTQEWIRQMS